MNHTGVRKYSPRDKGCLTLTCCLIMTALSRDSHSTIVTAFALPSYFIIKNNVQTRFLTILINKVSVKSLGIGFLSES